MSTIDRLDEIEARANAATEGPWRTWTDPNLAERGAAGETAWSHDEDGADAAWLAGEQP